MYERHLKNLRARHLQSLSESPILVLKEYLLALYRTQQTSSDMRQAISASRLPEEAEIADGFIPPSIWRVVHAKDKVVHLAARGWGSLSALATMAANAVADEELLVTALAIVAFACCNRIGETASIRVQDVDQSDGLISFFDRKTRMRWIKRPVSSYIRRLLGFIRATALRLGRRPTQNLVKGGVRPSSPPWYAFSPTPSTPTSDGIHGGAWGQLCSSAMELPCKSSCHGGDGNLSSSHAATSPHGMIVHGRIPRCPVQPCTDGRLEPGDLRVGHVHQDPSGQPPFCHDMTRGNPMDPMSRTLPQPRRQFQRSCPPPAPSQAPCTVQKTQTCPCCRVWELRGGGGGMVPPGSLSDLRYSPPSSGLPGPGSPSANQPVSLPQPRVRWRTGLSPSRPKHHRPPRGSSPEFSDDRFRRPRPVDVRTRRRWRSILWHKAGKVKLPQNLSFRDFWLPLFRIFMVIYNMMTGPVPWSVESVHALFSAVDSMRKSDFLIATIVISPTSPKPEGDFMGKEVGAHPADGSPVPVSVARRGLGSAGDVPIPLDISS